MAASHSTVLRILWSRFAWRHWRQSPVSSLLLLFILSIGVAAFFSIRLANRAAVASFEDFTGLITSQSDGVITAPAGALPETVFTDLRQLLGNSPVNLVPVLETSAVAPSHGGTEEIGSRPTFQLLGLDLPALVNVSGRQTKADDDNQGGWFGSKTSDETNDSGKGVVPGWRDTQTIFISEALAKRDGLKIGSPLPLVINEHSVKLRVSGIIPTIPNQPAAPADLLVMDLPALQQLKDKAGQLDRV